MLANVERMINPNQNYNLFGIFCYLSSKPCFGILFSLKLTFVNVLTEWRAVEIRVRF